MGYVLVMACCTKYEHFCHLPPYHFAQLVHKEFIGQIDRRGLFPSRWCVCSLEQDQKLQLRFLVVFL